MPPLIYSALADWRVYHFHDTSTFVPLRRSSSLTEPEQLAGDGDNLPAFLYFLQERPPSTCAMLVEAVRQVAPFLGTFVLQPEPSSTIVLDEPELGLHPAAIAQLAALMHPAAPKVQIIAATQSPSLANHFGWADFIVVDREEDASRFRRLTEAEVKPWMDDFAMGEIWEKNLVGGRP